MPVGDRAATDVLQTQHFVFDAPGKMSGYFVKCNGLNSENAVLEEKRMSGGNIEVVFKQPGRLTWGEFTLERGITNNMDMWAWRNEVLTGGVGPARTNCSLMLYTMDGTLAAQWDIVNAWPSKVDGPSFKADDDNVGVESLTLVFESFVRSQ
ncbi:MAG: phage tail protein [Chloroflexota bacterium]